MIAPVLAQTIDVGVFDAISKLGPVGLMALALFVAYRAIRVVWDENRRLTARQEALMDDLLPLIKTQRRSWENVTKVVGTDPDNGGR